MNDFYSIHLYFDRIDDIDSQYNSLMKNSSSEIQSECLPVLPLVPVPDSRMPDACFKTQLFLHSVLCH